MKVTKKVGSKKKTTKKKVKVTKKTPVTKKKSTKKKASTKSGAGVSATVTTQVGGETVEEKVEEVLDVVTEGPTATVGFNLGTTRAIGDHEFVKATVILTVPVNADGEIAVDMEKMEAPFNKIKEWCDNRLGAFMEEVGKVMDSEEEEADPLDALDPEPEDEEEEDDLDLDLLGEDEDEEEDEEDPFGLDEEVDEEVDEEDDDPFGLDEEEEDEDEEEVEVEEEVEEDEEEEDDDDILSILDGDEETEEETEEEDEDDPLGLGI